MPIIRNTMQLLLAPPGGLVYHLLIFFSLEAIVGLVVGAWQRRRVRETERVPDTFVIAAVGMLLARAVLVAVALAGVSEARVIPPLERALDMVVTLLLVWICLPWGRYQNLSWFFPGFGLLGTALIFVLFLSTWQADLAANPTLVYNGSWQETIWGVAQLALLGLAMLAFLWRRGREWSLWLVVLALLAAGHAFQLLVPYRNVHIAGWVRLTQLMAFPLLAVAVYRRVIDDLSSRAHELEEVSQDSLSQIAGLIYLLESGQRTVASLDMARVLDCAVQEVVRILKVDICGLIFPVDVTQGKANLAAAYSPRISGTADTIGFSLAKHPMLEHTIKRKKQVVIDATNNNTQVKDLYVLMGSIQVGPLLIQPLVHNNTVMGALLVGSYDSQQRFTAGQKKLCQALSRQVAVAIKNAHHYQVVTGELETLQAQFEKDKKEHQRIQAQLEAQFQQSHHDAAQFARRLDEATAYVKRKQQDIESLAEQLQEAEEEHSQLKAQVNQVHQEIRSLQRRLKEQIAQAQGTQAALEAQLAQANDQISQMALGVQEHWSHPSLADAVLDVASVGLLIAGENGRVNLVNATAAQLLTQPREQMLGQPIGQICGDVRWRQEINRLFDSRTGVSAAGSDGTFTIDKEGRPLAVKLHVLRDEDGRFVAIVVVLSSPAMDEGARRARDEFLGALTQELRTPMTSITGYTDLLLGESVGIISEMQSKFLQRIKANIERMGSMLSDLVGVTAIDSGQLYLDPEFIQVGEAIQEAILGTRAQLEAKDLALHLDLSLEQGSVKVDPNAFQQIMGNLINNACKASPVGGEIIVRANYEIEREASDQARLVVSVTDSGGGIASEDQPRVFDRFYQAEQALIAGLGETGVGLSIVKALVEAHNGQIWVESETKRGSTFAFVLPAISIQEGILPENNSSSSRRGR